MATTRRHFGADQKAADLDAMGTRLPPKERTAFDAARAGKPLLQLARAEGISVRSVQRSLQRALCRIRGWQEERDKQGDE